MSGRGAGLPSGIIAYASRALAERFRAPGHRVFGHRIMGATAVVLANAALLAMLASGDIERPAAVERPHTAFYIVPPAPPEDTSEREETQAAALPRPPSPVVPVAPPRIRTPEEEAVNTAIKPPTPDVPRGLAGLLGRDPCDDPRERLRLPDCPSAFGSGGSNVRAGDIENMQVAALEKEFGPQCTQLHGCLPMPTKTLNGLNPVESRSAMSAGAARLGGIHDLVGRLGPPNWYHVDPGFGD